MIRHQSDQQYSIELQTHAILRSHFHHELWNRLCIRVLDAIPIHSLRYVVKEHVWTDFITL